MNDKVEYGFDGIITYKMMAEVGEGGKDYLKGSKGKVPILATFGALEGLDECGGRDIAIYGTPHLPPSAYHAYGHVLGMVSNDEKKHDYKHRLIERNGFEFYVGCISQNPELVELQLSLIEAELTQAVGRARLVNHANRVHLFSNFPLEGGKLV